MADILDFAEIFLDVGATQHDDVQPQVIAVRRPDALAVAHVLGHPARDHVARGQLLLFRLVVGHEPVAVDVAQQTAIAATTLGGQDASRDDRGGVKLHRLHVAQRGDPGLQCQRHAGAFADDSVGRNLVDAPIPSGCNHGGPGQVGGQRTGDQIAHDRAVAATALMNQRQRLGAFDDRNPLGNRAIAQRKQHRVAGTVGGVAGPPFPGAAKIARGDQSMRVGRLGDRDPLGVDDRLALPGAHPVPRYAPAGQFAYGLWRGMDEHPGDLMVATPVRALDRVLEVHVLVIAAPHDRVTQTGLHAALGRGRMRALGRYQAEHQRIQPPALDADCGAQAGQPAADDQDIGVDQLHRRTASAHSMPGGTYGSP